MPKHVQDFGVLFPKEGRRLEASWVLSRLEKRS